MPFKQLQHKNRLEPEHEEVYKAYRQDPTPETTGALLRAIQPITSLGVKTYGGGNGPLAQGRARKIVVEALPQYDPQKASLKTHLLSHLRGLQRYAMQHDQPLAVPDRIVMDRHKLHYASQELRDQLGRDPSDEELADYSVVPVKRIEYVRKYKPGVSESEIAGIFSSRSEGDEADIFEPAIEGPDRTMTRANFLYPDLNAHDQLILEHSLGLHGVPRLSHKEIARKANISPAAVSQRAARIQAKLDELEAAEIF